MSSTVHVIEAEEDEREPTRAEDDEDEELMFAFDQDADAAVDRLRPQTPTLFRSISDFQPLERPANPLAAVLQDESRRRRDDEDGDGRHGEPRPFFRALHEPFDFNGRRKRKARDTPVIAVTPIIRPIPKRARLDLNRSATAPANLMRAPSPSGQPLSRSSSNEAPRDSEEKEPLGRPLSASIAIPASTFRPIRPASSLAGSTHSSASSSKSWAANFCRRSLDVSSPVRSRLNDLVLGSSAGRTTSFDGS